MKSLQNLSYKTLFTILFLSLAGIVFFLRIGKPAQKVSAAWWDEMWHYRKAIDIGNSGTAQTNTQIKILDNYDISALVNSGKLQSDLDDLRFTDNNGQLLNFWIEDATNNSVDIWAYVSSVPTTRTTIYMYYGNPSATSGVTKVGTSQLPGLSCKAVKQSGNTTNNIYYIDPTGGNISDAIQIYCDLTTDSGGWMLIGKSDSTIYTHAPGFYADGNVPTKNNRGSINVFNLSLINNNSEWAWIDTANDQYVKFYLTKYNTIKASPDTYTNAADDVGLRFISSNITNTSSLYQFTAVNSVELPANAGNFSYTTSTETTTYGRWGSAYYAGGSQSGARIFMITNNGGHEGAYGKYGLQRYNPSPYIAINSALMVRESSYSIDTNFVYSIQSEESSIGPIAYWKFDEGFGTTTYDSAGINNGIISGATYTDESQCITGKCLSFDGVNDYINNGNNVSLNPNNAITIEGWFYSNNFSQVYVPFAKNLQYRIHFHNTNNLYIDFYDAAGNRLYAGYSYSSLGITNSRWYHLAFSFDGYEVKTFVNGQYKNSKTGGTGGIRSDQGGNFYIGSDSGTQYFFNGKIDEVKIYPYARTADQIKQDYNSRGSASSQGSSVNLGSNKNSNSLSDGLVGYWKMDEGVGTNITDSSGNNNTGTFGTGTSAPTWTSGKFGIGTSFDGNDYINAGTSSIFNLNNQFSFETWINVSSLTPSWQFIMGKSSYWGVNDAGLHIKSTGLEFFVDNCRDSDYFTITTNKWYHIVGVYNGTNRQLYVDGKLEKNSSCTGKTLNNAYNFSIGADNEFTYNYSGLMDDVRLYNRALSPSEVSQLYNYAPGPIGYWDLNENTGTVAKDKSGNNNHGTLLNSPSWVQGKNGSALSFNGTNSALPLTSTINLGNANWTFSAWVKTNSTDVNSIISNSSGGPVANDLRVENSKMKYWHYNGGWINETGNKNIADGKWHYLTWVNHSNQTMDMYVDGVGDTLNVPSTIGGGGPVNQIGRNWYQSSNASIDEVKIYNYARTQKQIIEDMNAGAPATSAKSMVAYYRFDEGNSTIVNNSSNYGSSLNGNLQTGSSIPTWSNNGKSNKSLFFFGNDSSYVSITDPGANSPLDLTSQFTISTWVNINSIGAYSTILYKYGTFLLGVQPTGNIWSMINDGTWRTVYSSSAGTISNGKWQQITITYDAQDTKLMKGYINGKFVSSVGVSNSIVPNDNALFVGRGWTGENGSMNGSIDEVKIYNYALTDEEVKQDYNAGSAIQFGSTSQSIGGTTTSLEYCIPGDTSYCAPPIAEWKMDEGVGTSIVDTSGNNKNLTTYNNPLWEQGKIGKALNFNGSNQCARRTSDSSFNMTNGQEITVSTWVYPRRLAGQYQDLVVNRSGGLYNWMLYQHTTDGSIQLHGANQNKSTYIPPINQWTFISATVDSSGNYKLYANGMLVQNVTGFQYNPQSPSELSVGCFATLEYYQGKIDHVKIYNYARTPAQIAYDYNKGGPVGWWKFDECQGNIAYDWSGIGNTGVINIGSSGTQNSIGTCQIGTSAAWTNGASGKVNSSLNFDGKDDYLYGVGTSSMSNLINGSVSFWIYPKGRGFSTGNNQEIKVILPSDRPYIYGTGSIAIHWPGASSEYFGGTSLSDNIWTHVTVIWENAGSGSNNGIVKIYFNGILKTTVPNLTLPVGSSGNFYMGGLGLNASPFNGQIDDVRIYNYALTSEQIKQIYNGGAVNFR